MHPSVCFSVEKIIDVSVGEGDSCNYQVVWAPMWISSQYLMGCQHLIEDFLNHKRVREDNRKEEQCPFVVTDNDNEQLRNSSQINNITGDEVYRQEFTNEIHKRASMVLGEELSLGDDDSCFSNFGCDEGNIISSDGNIIENPGTPGSNVNPNFEWIDMNNENIFNGNDTNENVMEINNELLPSNSCHELNEEDNDDSHGLLFSELVEKSLSIDSPSMQEIKREYVEVKSEDIFIIEDAEIEQSGSAPKREFAPNQCKLCKKMFRNSSGLTRHTNRMHGGDEVFHCKLCKKNFESSVCLLQHAETCPNAKLHECHVCRKTFAGKSNLQQHMRSHTGQRAHKCTFCEKMFLTRTDLKRHTRVHTGERPFECPTCHNRFKINDHLQKHMRTHTTQSDKSLTVNNV